MPVARPASWSHTDYHKFGESSQQVNATQGSKNSSMLSVNLLQCEGVMVQRKGREEEVLEARRL